MSKNDTPALRRKGMVLKVSLVVVMIVLICCLAAYLVLANAQTQWVGVAEGKVLDQAGMVLAVLLGIAALLLIIVNGWMKEKPTLDPRVLRKELTQWQGELQGLVETMGGMQKEDVETCFYQIGIASEKLSDLVRDMGEALQQLSPEK